MAEAENQTHWAECVRRIAEDQHRESFMAVFDHFAPRINSYLQTQGMSADQAEDVTQDVLITLWRKAHLYKPDRAAVSTWLFRVARNRMIDRLRKDRAVAYDDIDDVAASELSVESDGDLAAESANLREALENLPKAQAEMVHKSYFEGKSHGEIAAETGIPLGTVKSHLRLALRGFRRQLGVEGP